MTAELINIRSPSGEYTESYIEFLRKFKNLYDIPVYLKDNYYAAFNVRGTDIIFDDKESKFRFSLIENVL